MGIGDIHNAKDPKAEMKFELHRIRLDEGGYTDSGIYYGVGMPLFSYYYDEGIPNDMVDGVLRAIDREDAKDKVRQRYPNAKFR